MSVASAVLLKPTQEGKGLDAKGKPAIRPYTPVSPPDAKGHIDFIIKRYDGGALTNHLHKDMKVGDEIAIKGARERNLRDVHLLTCKSTGPLPKHCRSRSAVTPAMLT